MNSVPTSAQRKTPTLGQELKRLREERGWTLEQAAKVTRIRVEHLHLLERDYYEKFPNTRYVCGLLRIYFRALGLAPDIPLDVWEKYLLKKKFPSEEVAIYLNLQTQDTTADNSHSTSSSTQIWGSKLIGALFAVVIFSILLLIYQNQQNTSSLAHHQTQRQDSTAYSESTQQTLPLIPREQLRSLTPPSTTDSPNPTEPNTTASESVEPQRLTTLSTPTTTDSSVPTPIENLPIVRPGKILNIPPAAANLQHNTTSSLDAPKTNIPQQQQLVLQHDTTTAISTTASNANTTQTQNPLQSVSTNRPANTPSLSTNVPPLPSVNSSTAFPKATPAETTPIEQFFPIDATPTDAEEVYLSDEEFANRQLRSAQVVATSQHPTQEQPLQPLINTPSENIPNRTIPRAIPVHATLSNPIAAPLNSTNAQTLFELHQANLNQENSSTSTETSQDSFPETSSPISLNQLRLELSREAYVRIFINDPMGAPAIDDVLPAGSSPTWQGNTFYVTIRPANAAMVFFNGQLHDYSHLGTQNINLRFP